MRRVAVSEAALCAGARKSEHVRAFFDETVGETEGLENLDGTALREVQVVSTPKKCDREEVRT